MNEQQLVESLVASVGDHIPAQADVIGLQQFTLDELLVRTRNLISLVTPQDDCRRERGDMVKQDDRTLVRLPQGGRAVLYHASGAMQYVSGLAPAESPFARIEDKEVLTRLINAEAARFRIGEFAGNLGKIAFERLWQVKAQGADLDDNMSEPTLFRIVGAYRHFIDGIPVLGDASVALKLAGDGQVDMLSVQVRPGAGEVIETVRIIDPEIAARKIARNLASVLGQAKDHLPPDVIESQTMQFGYLNLSKRKVQQLLAPVFVAQIALRHEQELQAYLFAVDATERSYLPLPLFGDETSTRARPTSGRKCPPVIE